MNCLQCGESMTPFPDTTGGEFYFCMFCGYQEGDSVVKVTDAGEEE